MSRGRRLAAWIVAVAAAAGLLGHPGEHPAEGADPKAGTWTGGGALGSVHSTPDGTAFALNFTVETFVTPNLSVGPLLQLGFTGDSSQVGLTGQVKYWLQIPNTPKELKLTPQAGLGFVHNSFRDGDTSFLLPLGVGVDYALSARLSVTGTFLLNITDLNTGKGSDADVMPGFTVGFRF